MSLSDGPGCTVMAVTHLTLRAPMNPGTTTRTGPPWTRGSGSEFICHASRTSRDIALVSGMELPNHPGGPTGAGSIGNGV